MDPMPGSSIVSKLQPQAPTLLLPHLYIPRNSTEKSLLWLKITKVEAWKPCMGSPGMEGLPSSGFHIYTSLHVLLELDVLGV